MGIKKFVILWRFQKVGRSSVTKCTKKKLFSKYCIFPQKKTQPSPKVCSLLEITLFNCILSQSYYRLFEISIKLQIFYAQKVLNWKKLAYLANLIRFFSTKTSLSLKLHKIMENTFSICLRFSFQINFQLSKIKRPKSLTLLHKNSCF